MQHDHQLAKLRAKLSTAGSTREANETKRAIEARQQELKRQPRPAPVPVAAAPAPKREEPQQQAAPVDASNDIALLKDNIREFQAGENPKLLAEFIRLLLQAERAKCRSDRQAGRTVARDALSAAIDTFFDAYTSIAAGCLNSNLWLTMLCKKFESIQPKDDNFFRYCWRGLVPRFWPCEIVEDHRTAVDAWKPDKRSLAEVDFYVDQGAANRQAYESILAGTRGRFRELAALCRLNLDHYQTMKFPQLVGQFSRLLTAVQREETRLGQEEEGCTTAADLDAIGAMLVNLYRQDFTPPDEQWREVLVSDLSKLLEAESRLENQYFPNLHTWTDPAKRQKLVDRFSRLLMRATADSDCWWTDGLTLVQNFAPACHAIRAEQLSRRAVLERFVGAAERYPMPTCA